MISRLLTLHRRQDGVAIPVVIGALAVTAGLAAGVFAVSLEGQHSSARDRDSKRALAAAEAGLQMAFLKLSEVRPTDSQCVTTAAVLPGTDGAAPGECPSVSGSLGNGATYSYVIATPTSGTCTTVPGKTPSAKDRCITSIGMVNGVRRRVQAKMLYVPPLKPFQEAGLIARESVVIRRNEVNIVTTVGANGAVTVSHGAQVQGGITVGPNGSVGFSNGGGATEEPTQREDEFEFAGQTIIDALYADAKQNNNNAALLTSGFYSNGGRSFSMGNNTGYTIPAGTYSFCSFLMQQGAKLRVPAGQVVKIFIDSPKRPGSGCANGTGTYEQQNATEVNREYGADPAQLDLYVYGRDGESTSDASIRLGNAAWLYAGIYAPDASLSLVNGGNVIGAATVKSAQIENNSDFIWDNRVINKDIPGTSETDSLGWFECAREPTVATDPESGCT